MKRIIIIITFFLFITCLTGCKRNRCSKKENISEDRVFLTIKSEYREKYVNHEIHISDFHYDNIEYIMYGEWHEIENDSYGFMKIYLKKHGINEVYKAIEHIRKLEFVKNVGPVVNGTIYV